jgi:hypothetical protein
MHSHAFSRWRSVSVQLSLLLALEPCPAVGLRRSSGEVVCCRDACRSRHISGAWSAAEIHADPATSAERVQEAEHKAAADSGTHKDAADHSTLGGVSSIVEEDSCGMEARGAGEQQAPGQLHSMQAVECSTGVDGTQHGGTAHTATPCGAPPPELQSLCSSMLCPAASAKRLMRQLDRFSRGALFLGKYILLGKEQRRMGGAAPSSLHSTPAGAPCSLAWILMRICWLLHAAGATA